MRGETAVSVHARELGSARVTLSGEADIGVRCSVTVQVPTSEKNCPTHFWKKSRREE